MKKNIIFRLAFLLVVVFSIALLLPSCGEDEVNSFSGTITDMASGESVDGVKVYLDAAKLSSGSVNSAYIQIAEVTTGSDGRYYFECKQDAYLKFRIRLEKDDYHSDLHEFEPQDQIAHYSNDFSFARESYLHVTILNILPYNDDDEFKIRIENINEECTDCCNADFRHYYGSYTDTSFFCNAVGGDSVIIYSISIHNEESIIKSNRVYCTPGDTIFYNAYY